MIKYTTIENVLTPDPNDYYPQIQITGRAGKDELVERMVSMGSTITRPDLLAAMDLLDEAALALIKEGYRVDLAGIVDLYPRMQGVFNGPSDGFDKSRHTLSVGANPSPSFIARVRADVSVQKAETIIPAPLPLQYSDAATHESNGPLTPGNIGTLTGSRLKFDPAAADEGIYFLGSGDGSETKVSVISINKPGQIVFLVPVLPSGQYDLQVRARVNRSKDIRKGTLDATLIVP